MDTLYSSLRNDRMITIFVGSDLEPIHIQQSLLCNTADYFKTLLTNDHFQEALSGVARFPEDDVESWKLLAYWAMHRKLPDVVNIVNFCTAWYLGQKYLMPDFQDEVMYAILNEALDSAMSDEAFVELFAVTIPGTKPRQLFAELLVDLVVHDGLFQWSDFPQVQGEHSYMASILAAMDDLKSDGFSRSRGDLRTAVCHDGKPLWMRYMVGAGPKQAVGWYWHHDSEEWSLA
ncbi:hypothetical protein CERZMDRAFT_93391 [Cercospora zeae-maydis SCOH1-5]|uniref:BTB domain-containing protein n=1 Tax=Cercospora zeae-maydis SCOH1-5 TaxID=717836 RepID=A0A6A6FVS6_9PEZI|nr:hypothetical protein CERZMDRAFT_93391 [Cercospora zeae-maydis SCOH1-5]